MWNLGKLQVFPAGSRAQNDPRDEHFCKILSVFETQIQILNVCVDIYDGGAKLLY